MPLVLNEEVLKLEYQIPVIKKLLMFKKFYFAHGGIKYILASM